MKKSMIYWLIGVIAIILVIVIAILSMPKGEKTTIKIGVSLPLTGGLAIIGEPMMAAIDLAVEDANTNSKKYNFVAIYEDDQFSPSVALTGVQKLINIDRVDFLITAGSPVGMAIGPVAEENKLIHFGIASADVAGIGSYNFNHWTPPQKQAEKMVEEFKKLGISRISIIIPNHEGGMAIRNALVEELNKNNIAVLVEEKFIPGEKDFKTIWRKIENSNPEIIFFGAQTPEFEIALKQRTELGYNTPLTAIESPKYSESPDLFNGNWFVDAASTDPSFVSTFEKRSGKNIFTFSGNAYDIVSIIAKKLNEFNEKPSSEQFKNALLKLDYYEGVMGPMNMDEKGNLLTEAIKLNMVNGVPVKID